jgi:hypothetical protein
MPVVAVLPAAERAEFAALRERFTRVEAGGRIHIARSSHILIAVYDDATTEAGAPVAELVEGRLSGLFAHGTAPAVGPPHVEPGPVYHVPTRGAERVDGAFVARFPQRFSGDERFEKDFTQALKRLDQYNADLARFGASDGQPATIEALRDRTSATASRLQTITFRFLYLLYFAALVGTALQFATSQFWRVAVFPIAFVAYRIARHFDYENRYQDYRTLSEGLRVQAAWFSCGLTAERADSGYLGMQETELQWIRMALGYAHFAFRAPDGAARVVGDGCRAWIDEQWRYFSATPRREERDLNRLRIASRAMFWLAIAISLVVGALLYLPPVSHLVSWQPAAKGELLRVPATAFGLYAAIALLIANYSDKRGFGQNVRRYDRMFAVYDRARKRLDATPGIESEEARELVRELGRAALIENADWLLTRRERPIAFVT